jgi:8-oxo-dGTP pyrophosphatase MutT (NUDIX family)
MRTNNQIAVFFTFKDLGINKYLLVKRTQKRGGFWQAVSGGEEDFDNGDLLNTAVRETKEELDLDISKDRIQDLMCDHEFEVPGRGTIHESFFGVILDPSEMKNIRLSDEHDNLVWSGDIEYLKGLIPFQKCREALEHFSQLNNFSSLN